MKLQQLCYLVEVTKQGLNVSDAAKKLRTSQPGISKQIRMLEEELGVQIFIRNGKRFVDVTAPGREIIKIAEHILLQSGNLKRVVSDHMTIEDGELTVATTHIQARYALPKIIQQFCQRYPKVQLRIKQTCPTEVCKLVINGEADLAIAAESIALYPELAMLACYAWHHHLIVPATHPLVTRKTPLTLAELCDYPLITYDATFAGCFKIDEAFAAQKLSPNIVLTAVDSEIIKEYVKLGLGVGIITSVAFDHNKDPHLRMIDVSHLFSASVTQIGFRKDTYLRAYMYDFIEIFSPHLGRPAVQAALLYAMQ